MTGVGDAFRAPVHDDRAAWNTIATQISKGRTFVRDEAYLRDSSPEKPPKKPKGVRSLFQLPARKRRRKLQEIGS